MTQEDFFVLPQFYDEKNDILMVQTTPRAFTMGLYFLSSSLVYAKFFIHEKPVASVFLPV